MLLGSSCSASCGMFRSDVLSHGSHGMAHSGDDVARESGSCHEDLRHIPDVRCLAATSTAKGRGSQVIEKIAVNSWCLWGAKWASD